MDLLSASILSSNGGNTNLTTDSSTRCSGGVLSLAFGFWCTIWRFMSLVGSIDIHEFVGGVSVASSSGNTTNSEPVSISSADTSSSGLSWSLISSINNRTNDDSERIILNTSSAMFSVERSMNIFIQSSRLWRWWSRRIW